MNFFKKLLGGKPFDPGEFSVHIRYQNYLGEEKTFVGDRRTLRRRHNHLSLKVVPRGLRIALNRDRIRNLAEVDLPGPTRDPSKPQPTKTERKVLAYHKNHGTTSPLYRNLLSRFPDYFG